MKSKIVFLILLLLFYPLIVFSVDSDSDKRVARMGMIQNFPIEQKIHLLEKWGYLDKIRKNDNSYERLAKLSLISDFPVKYKVVLLQMELEKSIA